MIHECRGPIYVKLTAHDWPSSIEGSDYIFRASSWPWRVYTVTLTVHSGAEGVSGRALPPAGDTRSSSGQRTVRVVASGSERVVDTESTRHGRFLRRLRGTGPGVAARRDRRVPDVRQLSAQGSHRAAAG